MRKVLTLFTLFVTALSAMAQMHGTLRFIGNGEFYLPNMLQSYTATVKDAVTVTMGDDSQSFDVPSMTYAAMGMSIPSFTLSGLTYAMTGSPATGDMAFEWKANGIETAVTDASGAEKKVNVSEFSAAYAHASGRLTMSLTFKYGAMPFDIYYSVTAYYTKDNALNLAGQGTQGNPYKIYDATDFMAIARNISGENTFDGVFFEQMNDIDFGGSEASPVQLPAIGKAAITNISAVAWGFDGTYDGNSKSIKGIYHTANGNDDAGKFNALFSSVGAKGTVKNVVFDAGNHVSAHSYAGAIASVSQGVIDNCRNDASVTAVNAFASGICAYMVQGKGTVRYCENNGDIRAMTYASGIISGTQSGKAVASYGYLVEHCVNNGNVSSSNGTGSAGIAGSYSGAIVECVNNGNIDDTAKTTGLNTGGILSGGSYVTEITGCHNTGKVSGGKSVGGIVGTVMKADDADLKVTGCRNDGEVTAAGVNVAGIMANTGRVNGIVTLDNCANNGQVSTAAETDLIGNLRGNAVIVLDGCTIGSALARLPLDPVQTGIADVSVSGNGGMKDGKHILDGRLVIVKGGKIYSVAGAEY